FMSLDLTSGYWQVEVKEKDKEKTAFITKYGLYEFNIMPFGLCNIPSIFQRLIDVVLRLVLWKKAMVYIDNINIYFISFEQHILDIQEVIKPDPQKVNKLNNLPPPKTINQLRAFLDLASYYRCFIEGFSTKAGPLLKLLKKDEPFIWEKPQDKVFNWFKYCLTHTPILQYLDYNEPFILFTDASYQGL
ncbi:445_t:CDS:2, partial [Dentiscutata heterogama]